jgi:signal transduction histidine kinase
MTPVRALGIAMVALAVAAVLIGPVGTADARVDVLLAVFAVGATAYLAWGAAPAPIAIALLAAAGAALVGVYAIDTTQVPVGLFVLGAAAPTHRPLGAALAVVAAVTVAHDAVQLLGGHDTWPVAVATAAGVAFFAAIGRLFVREREQRQRIAQLLAEVEAGREAERAASIQAERARMARELHDVLAHTLSGLAIQLETARLLAADAATAPALRAAVESSHRLSRAGLQEARRAVGALRGEELPGPQLLPQLVDEHRLASGSAVRFEMSGDPVTLSPDAGLALYRAAQEALTNVRKHALGAATEIALTWSPGAVVLVIENALGERAAAAGTGAGYGLAGMTERAEQVGAQVRVGSDGDVFRVRWELRLTTSMRRAPET